MPRTVFDFKMDSMRQPLQKDAKDTTDPDLLLLDNGCGESSITNVRVDLIKTNQNADHRSSN